MCARCEARRCRIDTRRWVITAALPESEDTVSEAIREVPDCSSVQASFDAPGLSAGSSPDQAAFLVIVRPFPYSVALEYGVGFPLVFCCWLISLLAVSSYCSVVNLTSFRLFVKSLSAFPS